jgi:hypothetical protein
MFPLKNSSLEDHEEVGGLSFINRKNKKDFPFFTKGS